MEGEGWSNLLESIFKLKVNISVRLSMSNFLAFRLKNQQLLLKIQNFGNYFAMYVKLQSNLCNILLYITVVIRYVYYISVATLKEITWPHFLPEQDEPPASTCTLLTSVFESPKLHSNFCSVELISNLFFEG